MLSNIFRFLLFSVFVFLMNSCVKKVPDVKTNTITGQSVRFSVDTVRIPIDSVTSGVMTVYDYFSIDQTEYLFFYNQPTHTLFGYNLTVGEYSHKVQFQYNGINGVGDIESMHIHNLDSILIYERGKIKIVDTGARVLSTINLIRNTPDNLGFLLNTPWFKINYFAKKKSILLFNIYGSANMEASLSNPIAALVQIDSKEILPVPIYFSDYIKTNNGRFGYLWDVNMLDILTDGTVLYTFAPESNIYAHNLLTRESNKYEAVSQFTGFNAPAIVEYTDRIQGRKHLIENPRYYGVLYDKYRDCYYRIHRGYREFTSDDDGNEVRDVNFYVTILDHHFKYVDEIELPKNTYVQFIYFVSSKGLCLNAASSFYPKLKDDEIELHAYSFFSF